MSSSRAKGLNHNAVSTSKLGLCSSGWLSKISCSVSGLFAQHPVIKNSSFCGTKFSKRFRPPPHSLPLHLMTGTDPVTETFFCSLCQSNNKSRNLVMLRCVAVGHFLAWTAFMSFAVNVWCSSEHHVPRCKICDCEYAERRLGILKIDIFRFWSSYRICCCRRSL